MPTVDFTLDDIRKLIDERVPELFSDFYDTNFSPVFEGIDDQFDDIRGQLNDIRAEIKGIRRIVRKHSSDIAELQADRGL